ncbi:MAG TPA: response regulator [Candidatus Sulfotelmatobacter sp.]|nr:response regulator [Candidatus Sulfotelmatobacter sp.]
MFGNKKSVLIVDDEESIRTSLQRILERAGYRVKTANTGKEGLKKAKDSCFDVILIDIKLPDITGTELLLKLPKDQEIVKIIITGYSSIEAGATAADYGADDFLVKPIQPQELLKTIEDRLAKV